jgi:ankyrin repeat protein
MPRRITPRTTLDNLKKEAKRWLRALQGDAADARARFERALDSAPGNPTLRDVQLALAREHGLPGWAALKELLGERPPQTSSLPDVVVHFLENACPDHHVRGGPAHVRARHTAMRLLARYPELAHGSIAAEVVCGDLAAVEHVSRLSSLVSPLSPKNWQPLLFLAFTRLPLPAANDNAVAIATLLLDRGADPNAFFMAGDSRYTPLVGAVGEGEEDRPPHPHRDELVKLLLARGAEPYDMQVIYNIHFHGSVLWFLELIHARSLQLGRDADWKDPDWPMLDMGGYGNGARWHLWIAIKNNDVRLAEWCLSHGANPNAGPARAKLLPQQSLYEEAVRNGCDEIAALLLQYGAVKSEIALSAVELFGTAAFRLDAAAAQAQLAQHPELLNDPRPLFAAATRDRADVVAFLLDLGISPDVENVKKERALHRAAYNNALAVAQLLIDRGAAIDPVEANWNNTPLAAAIYAQHQQMIALLGRYSRDIWELVYSGCIARVRELLAEQSELAKTAGGGHTLLMWLPPQDEELAIEIARLLLRHGADPALKNTDGATAADRAEQQGMFELAAILRDAATPADTRPTLARYEQMAATLLEAYRTGTPEAMRRHWNDTWPQRAWAPMRRHVLLDLGRVPGVDDAFIDISLDDAHLHVAKEHAFESWEALVAFVTSLPPDKKTIAGRPVEVFSRAANNSKSDQLITRDWDVAIEMMTKTKSNTVDAHGQMTDDVLDRVSQFDHVTSLRLGGSKALTDAGIRHLASMPQLRHLDLSGTQVTDRALAVLRNLPALESINLAWTRTGDGAIKALAGKVALSHLVTGVDVTDAGLPLLHDLPVFKKWQDGEVVFELTSADAEPNMLVLRGTFTDRGLAALAGLDGLFGLDLDDRNLAITAAGLAPLITLPNLGKFSFHAHDDAMSYIAAMPKLRFLGVQDTDASDDGWVALSRSQSIEGIWGRRCHNLGSRGFRALGTMPALGKLAVSCKNVDDDALSVLPAFPSLREIMPMDVPDAGYRHIGACEQLEALTLMYCRDTTDAATEQITSLRKLRRYFASYTQITDRTPELLSGISSLEVVTFSGCAALTNTGAAALARLPRLREVTFDGPHHVTQEVLGAFAANVKVTVSG